MLPIPGGGPHSQFFWHFTTCAQTVRSRVTKFSIQTHIERAPTTYEGKAPATRICLGLHIYFWDSIYANMSSYTGPDILHAKKMQITKGDLKCKKSNYNISNRGSSNTWLHYQVHPNWVFCTPNANYKGGGLKCKKKKL